MIGLLMVALALSTPVSPTSSPSPCRTSDLSIAFDGKDGEFNGMSHSGTLMVVTQRGPAACLLPGLPTLTFTDAGGNPLPLARRAPPGMHPGPAVIPVRLAPGAQATTALRWVSGEVYEKSRCVVPAKAIVTIGGKPISVPFAGHFCGEAGKPVPFDQPVLKAGKP